MDENETAHPDYQKGFNEGYIMKQHLPEMADKLAEAVGSSVRSEGFRDGRQQGILDQRKDYYPNWLKSDRLPNLNNDINKSKDKDMDDLER